MELTSKHWESIHTYQKNQIHRIIHEKKYAERISTYPENSKIGIWITNKNGNKVLELGCGPGRYVAILKQLGFDVTGVDPVSYPTWSLFSDMDNVTLISGINAEELPFGENEFDHVVCTGALLYFKDINKAISEVKRVLKLGGTLLIMNVNPNNLYTRMTGRRLDPVSKNLLNKNEMSAFLINNGFTILDLFIYGFWPPCFTQYWWYLVNGKIPKVIQRLLSLLTPVESRLCLTVISRNS